MLLCICYPFLKAGVLCNIFRIALKEEEEKKNDKDSNFSTYQQVQLKQILQKRQENKNLFKMQ